MIVLDTNVVPEAIKNDAHPGVRQWLNEQSADPLGLTPSAARSHDAKKEIGTLESQGRGQPAIPARICYPGKIAAHGARP